MKVITQFTSRILCSLINRYFPIFISLRKNHLNAQVLQYMTLLILIIIINSIQFNGMHKYCNIWHSLSPAVFLFSISWESEPSLGELDVVGRNGGQGGALLLEEITWGNNLNIIIIVVIVIVTFITTRSYAALRAVDLDWIVGRGYSLGGTF